MALGFQGNRRADGVFQMRVVVRGTQRAAQVAMSVLAKACVDFASAGDPHAIAAFAEIVGHGRDQPDLLAGFGQFHITRRAACIERQISQGKAFGHGCSQVIKRPVLRDPVLVADIAHGHDFDERQVHTAGRTPVQQGEQFVLVKAFQGDGVDLDTQARLLGRINAVDHLGQAAPAGDLREFIIIQRIKRHIHAAHTSGVKIVRVFRQLAAVGRQRQFTQRAAVQMARHCIKERHNPAPHQWFAARDAQLFDAKADKRAAKAVKLFKRQQVFLGQKGHVFRHAVDAAKIAAVSDGNPQVADRAREWVDQGRIHIPERRAGQGGAQGHNRPLSPRLRHLNLMA